MRGSNEWPGIPSNWVKSNLKNVPILYEYPAVKGEDISISESEGEKTTERYERAALRTM